MARWEELWEENDCLGADYPQTAPGYYLDTVLSNFFVCISVIIIIDQIPNPR